MRVGTLDREGTLVLLSDILEHESMPVGGAVLGDLEPPRWGDGLTVTEPRI